MSHRELRVDPLRHTARGGKNARGAAGRGKSYLSTVVARVRWRPICETLRKHQMRRMQRSRDHHGLYSRARSIEWIVLDAVSAVSQPSTAAACHEPTGWRADGAMTVSLGSPCPRSPPHRRFRSIWHLRRRPLKAAARVGACGVRGVWLLSIRVCVRRAYHLNETKTEKLSSRCAGGVTVWPHVGIACGLIVYSPPCHLSNHTSTPASPNPLGLPREKGGEGWSIATDDESPEAQTLLELDHLDRVAVTHALAHHLRGEAGRE